MRYRIFYIDWLNNSGTKSWIDLTRRFPSVTRISPKDTIAETLRYCAENSDTAYFWVASSLVDYKNFHFKDYGEYGFEPYLQVFNSSTWFGSKEYFRHLDGDLKYVEAFPNLHFVKDSTLKASDGLLDIVYISNGEPLAENHYQHLQETVKTGNMIRRIDGINGRTAAYQAAARASTTAWFFAVFAKIEVDPNFDWTWQPKQEPWHTIFYAKNPVNGLTYGHMAVVAYNKYQTLVTDKTGLDFVMTKPHEIVPTISGTAHYNQDPWTTWRTAFREAIKLKQSNSDESRTRLKAWTDKGTGKFATWSNRGARDGAKYYDEVNGEQSQLLLSYDWAWLNDRYQSLYSQLPPQ